MLRSFLAILAGWVATVALVMLSTLALAQIMLGTIQPQVLEGIALPQSYVIANLICGFIAAMVGGYLAAQLSPRSGLLHAGILAAINLAMAMPMVLGGAQAGQPEWYPLVIAFIGVVGTLDGGFIWRYMGGGRRLAYAV